jgi:hypothetical protein
MGRPFKKGCPLTLTVSICVLAAGGCASTTYAHQAGDGRIQGAFEQPFRDVSVMRENPPDVLIHAVQAPYAMPGDGGCVATLNEIAALDSVLGPDLDAANLPRAQSNTDIAAIVSGAIGGVIGLPFRSIVRTLSGAENRARVVREAIFAGMVRRAFLRGAAHAGNCTTTSATPSAPPAAGADPVADPSSQEPDAVVPIAPQGNASEPSAPPPLISASDVQTASAVEPPVRPR